METDEDFTDHDLEQDEAHEDDLKQHDESTPGSPSASSKKLKRKNTLARISTKMFDKIAVSAEKSFTSIMKQIDLVESLMKFAGFVITDIDLQIGNPCEITIKIKYIGINPGDKVQLMKNLNNLTKKVYLLLVKHY